MCNMARIRLWQVIDYHEAKSSLLSEIVYGWILKCFSVFSLQDIWSDVYVICAVDLGMQLNTVLLYLGATVFLSV